MEHLQDPEALLNIISAAAKRLNHLVYAGVESGQLDAYDKDQIVFT